MNEQKQKNLYFFLTPSCEKIIKKRFFWKKKTKNASDWGLDAGKRIAGGGSPGFFEKKKDSWAWNVCILPWEIIKVKKNLICQDLKSNLLTQSTFKYNFY